MKICCGPRSINHAEKRYLALVTSFDRPVDGDATGAQRFDTFFRSERPVTVGNQYLRPLVSLPVQKSLQRGIVRFPVKHIGQKDEIEPRRIGGYEKIPFVDQQRHGVRRTIGGNHTAGGRIDVVCRYLSSPGPQGCDRGDCTSGTEIENCFAGNRRGMFEKIAGE